MTPTRALCGLFVVSLAACTTVGPAYERPEYAVPDAYRAAEVAGGQGSIGDLGWWDVYQDPALQGLIEDALTNNYDVAIAAERVVAARARLTITSSELYPDVRGGGEFRATRDTKNSPTGIPPGVDKDNTTQSVFADLVWEVDFWGRIESATQAARAELLATDLAQRAVVQTLIADIALAYYDLLELDRELEIARSTLDLREKSLELVSLRLEFGVANKVELRQAEGLVHSAASLIPFLEKLIEQRENLIQFLVGGDPAPVDRGWGLVEQVHYAEVPAGLPSELLERRPDVVIAEQNLIAANARIGEAKALLYPTIALTGTGGVASDHLSDLFKHDSLTWALVPSATIPIFNAGRLEAGVEVTESRQREVTLVYLQTLQGAFREVSDALVEHSRSREVRAVREKLVVSNVDRARLSDMRYRGGVTSYLEPLDSERARFEAELALAQSIRDQLFSTVLLYRALGGGWQGTDADGREPAVEEVDEEGADPTEADDTASAK